MQDPQREHEVYESLRDLSRRFWINRRTQLHLSKKVADGVATDDDIQALESLRCWAAENQRTARSLFAELLELRGYEEEIDPEPIEEEYHWGDRLRHDLNCHEFDARSNEIVREHYEEHGLEYDPDWRENIDWSS